MTSQTAGIEPSCAMNDAVAVEELSFRYGRQPIIREVSMHIPQGAFVSLLGPSGSGKTTLLKLIGGYLLPTSGRIRVQQRDVTLLPPNSRNIGMVFQNHALFPHLSARGNVAFGLEVRGTSKAMVRERVELILDRVGLAADERDRFPSQLSGGQQQRVALARALAFGPPILLLDEPLASLDRHLREQLRTELRAIHSRSQVTTLMVTHDQSESLAISDLIGIVKDGKLLQFGPPRELYERPRTPFVAQFVGNANLIPAQRIGLQGGLLMIRPELVRIGTQWPGRITGLSYRGTNQFVELDCDLFPLKFSCPASVSLTVGDRIHVDLPRDSLWDIPELDDE
jgi:ABC-type Fe3+/spermidine/putrescine transport system ATPase subunit